MLHQLSSDIDIRPLLSSPGTAKVSCIAQESWLQHVSFIAVCDENLLHKLCATSDDILKHSLYL